MNNQPLFIVGTERSGSNLLRAILNSHSRISVPHPPHIMKELGPRLERYGDLSNDENFYRLIDDVIKLVKLHFVAWPVELNRDLLFKSAKTRSLYSINAAIYDDYAKHMKKNRWGCKSTFMIHYIEEILKVHPAAQFIHLVRDGRDVAVSARKSVFNHFHPYYVAKLWSREQALALFWSEKLPPSQFKTIHYEKLTARPQETVREICAFLNEEYQEDLLNYFKKKDVAELSKLSESWKNISRAVLSDNSNKYKKELGPNEIALFEAISLRELEAFGYSLDTDKSQLDAIKERLTTRVKIGYYLEEKLSQLKVELGALMKDKNFVQRWKKRLYVWSLHD
ncbi:MAG: sulfotransferase family protein [Bacteriovorax sp.]